MKERYFKDLLGQILKGEQCELKEIIDLRMDEGHELEGVTVYSFESLRIYEAITFLENNYACYKNLIR